MSSALRAARASALPGGSGRGQRSLRATISDGRDLAFGAAATLGPATLTSSTFVLPTYPHERPKRHQHELWKLEADARISAKALAHVPQRKLSLEARKLSTWEPQVPAGAESIAESALAFTYKYLPQRNQKSDLTQNRPRAR